MVRCSFCNNNLAIGTGKMYIKKDGKTLWFCTSKCEKNMLKLNRKPRTTKWTGEFQKIKKEAKK